MIPAVKYYNEISDELARIKQWIENMANLNAQQVDYHSRKSIKQREAFKKIRSMLKRGRHFEGQLESLRSNKSAEIEPATHWCACCQKMYSIVGYCEDCTNKKLNALLADPKDQFKVHCDSCGVDYVQERIEGTTWPPTICGACGTVLRKTK